MLMRVIREIIIMEKRKRARKMNPLMIITPLILH